MTVSRHSGFRSGLHTCHCGNGIVEDDENKFSPIIYSIQESRGARMIGGRISNRGNDGNVFAVLMIGLIEAAGESDGSPHVVTGIYCFHIHSQSVTPDIAGKDTLWKGLFQGEERRPVWTSRTEGWPTNGKTEIGHHFLKRGSGSHFRHRGG